MAFCGLVNQAGTAILLRRLAAVLSTINGFLDIYSPYTSEQLGELHGLNLPNVRQVGFFPPHELAERLPEATNALFLPASFEPHERTDISTLFPSKLADYSAIGLPIVIWGPTYSSAARWASENPGATLLITENNDNACRDAIESLMTSSDAELIAHRGVIAGKKYFQIEQARGTLLSVLQVSTKSNAN